MWNFLLLMKYWTANSWNIHLGTGISGSASFCCTLQKWRCSWWHVFMTFCHELSPHPGLCRHASAQKPVGRGWWTHSVPCCWYSHQPLPPPYSADCPSSCKSRSSSGAWQAGASHCCQLLLDKNLDTNRMNLSVQAAALTAFQWQSCMDGNSH